MIKTVRVMLCPNNRQNTRFFEFAGAARFAYNKTLEWQYESLGNNEGFISDGELRKRMTILKQAEGFEWLNTVSNNVLKQAVKDACTAFWNWTKHGAKKPKFKSRKHTAPSFYQDNIKISFTDTHVKLEKLTLSKRRNRQVLNSVRLAEKGRIPTDSHYHNPRIVFDGLNWYLTVGIECEDMEKERTGRGIGIDVGIKYLAVCSDGHKYENINKNDKMRKLEKRRRRFQRSVSRKYEKNRKGASYCKTRNIIKREKELLCLAKRMSDIRHDHIHKATSGIMKREPSFICIEDLNVRGMMENRHLAKAIQEQALYEFGRQISYKAEWKSIPVIKAHRFYASSKTCMVCGHIKRDLKLSERIYHCPSCGNVTDRDEQASINLERYGQSMMTAG